MASDRIICTKRKNVFMAHMCSECGFPMITTVKIEAEAQKTYTFSLSRAEEIANETAENAIYSKIRQIETCRPAKQPLEKYAEGSGMISMGLFCAASFSGYDSYCPKCLNLEPWKRASSKKKMDELEKDNFPVVFMNAESAKQWATEKVDELVSKMEIMRKDPNVVFDATEKAKEIKIEIELLNNEKKSFPEIARYETLWNEISTLITQKSKLGIFDFKMRKVLNDKIKILDLQFKDLKEKLDKKLIPIEEKIKKLEKELFTVQTIAFGCAGDFSKESSVNASTYFFVPNEIPNDIISEIEKQTTKRLKEEQPVCSNTTELNTNPAFSDEILYCRKCGFKLLSGSEFCTKCGTKIR